MEILSRKLDATTLGEWEERVLTLVREPIFRDFRDFLEDRAMCLEMFTANNQQQIHQRADWSERRRM